MKNHFLGAGAALVALCLVACGDDDGTPGNDAGAMDAAQTDAGTADAAMGSTIVDVASANDDFSTLVAAVVRADLADTLSGAGPFTVFAPTNDAFTASGITDVETVPVETLRQILLYHVVAAEVPSGMVMTGPVDSAAELTLFLNTEGGVTINGGNGQAGGANVDTPDVEASNGVIHVIDRVLLPPDIPTAAAYAGLTGLLDAVGAAAEIAEGTSVADALSGDGPFTVFAPTNAAFGALDATPDAETLRDVLLHHVVSEAVPSSELPAAAPSLLENAWGNATTLLFATEGGARVNGAAISATDIRTTNGIVHLIDAVILPPNVVGMAGIAGLSELGNAVGSAADLDGTPLAEVLAGAGPFTVFAPTNDAFGRAPSGLSAEALRDVLTLHVVGGEAPVLAADIPATAPSVLGQDLTFDTSAMPLTVAGPGGATGDDGVAGIIVTDVHVTNGVVHVIDQVVLPGS